MNDNIPAETEIDLLYILKSVKRGFSSLLQSIKNLILFCLKNIKTLLIFIVIGVSISIGIFSIKKTVYVSGCTISHSRLSNAQCSDLIDDLTKSNNDTLLAKKLRIDIKIADQIKKISYVSLSKTTDKDSLLQTANFKIEVKVYSTRILDTLQKRILNYLESNEYATKRKALNALYLDRFEERIKNQIIAVDSLKRIVDKSILPKSIGNGIILGESIDPVKVYQEGMSLFQSQLKISEQRELNNSFEIILGFSTPVPSSGLLFYLLSGFFSSLVLGLLWLLRKNTILK